jgi:glycosyltransferase involved in cell wall biosynthesis
MIFIGAFPPPIHGAAEINERVVQLAAAEKIDLVKCNASPLPGSTGLRYHVSRVRAYLRVYYEILRCAPHAHRAAYVSLSGGFGLCYDLAAVALCRIKGLALIFHHHSFAYLDTPSLIVGMIVRAAGRRQAHIALCPIMAQRLHALYGSHLQIVVVSNLTLLDLAVAAERSAGAVLRTLGYLSNISFEKGIDRYLDLLALLRAGGSRIKGLIAGPFQDDQVRAYVERRMAEIGEIDYLGPVYDARKAEFFASIDLLVFPSRYGNEAEPLVLYEALAAGIPSAASARGCIAGINAPASIFLLNATGSDLDALAQQIRRWEKDAEAYANTARAVRGEFAALQAQRTEDAERLRQLLRSYEDA